jgi:sorbitol/mannitol transport system substrate-binding protein
MGPPRSSSETRPHSILVPLVALVLLGSACRDDDASASRADGRRKADRAERSIKVAIVGNPQMEDIAKLTPGLFTARTGVVVNYTILEEQTLREVVTRDVGARGRQFNVVMIGMFEAPQFGRNGWLVDLTPYATSDADYDLDDLIPAVRKGLSYEGRLYASPFYGESSFLMYRKDLLDAAGLSMPDEPTWDEVAQIARALDSDETAGICLRGKPGWGDLGSVFTTVLNTFGGTWWLATEDGNIGAAQVDQPEFAEALNFYVDLIHDAGEDDAANASFNECLNQYLEGKVAMWYDATVAAGLLEADDSAVKGLNGYALAPT